MNDVTQVVKAVFATSGLNAFMASFDKAENSVSKLTKVWNGTKNVGKNLTKYVTLPTLAIGGAAVKSGLSFEKQMNRVSAIAGATGKELKALEKQAIDLGASTIFGASDVAKAQEQLASAGFTVNDILKATPGLMDLAAVSGGDMALAAEAAANAINQFGLEMSTTGHVADVYARAAADTNAETADMAEAMKFAGPVASALGLTLEETAAAVGIMSDAGIKGSQAGTSLRGALTRLANPSKDAVALMEDLGIKMFDANGKMYPLEKIIRILQSSFSGLTDEQKQQAVTTLFGQNAMSGMLSLINSSPGEFSNLQKSLENSDGSAREMADTINSGLSGSLEGLMGSIETLSINISKTLAPHLNKLVKWLDKVVDSFNGLSQEQQENILKFIGLFAVIGPVIGIIAKIVGVVSAVVKGFVAFSKSTLVVKASAGILGKAFALLTGPIGIIIAVVGALIGVFVHLYRTNENFRNGVLRVQESIKNAFVAVGEWFVGLKDKIVEAWNAVIEWFKSLPEKFNAFWQEVSAWASSIPGAISEWLSGIWTTFTDWLNNLWNSFITWLGNLWNKTLEMLSGFWKKVKDFISNLPYYIGFILGTVLALIVKWGVETWAKANEIATNIFNAVIEWFKKLPGEIWNWVTSAYEKVTQWGADMIEKAKETGMKFLNAFIEWFLKLPVEILKWVSTAYVNVTNWGRDMLNKAAEIGSNFFRTIGDWFYQLPGKIWSWIVGAIAKVGEWGANLRRKGAEAANLLFNAVKNGVASIPGAMYNIGANLIKGFWNGIVSVKNWLWNQVSGFFSGILDGVKGVFGIHSPSKVFRNEIGKMLPAGLVKGVEDDMPGAFNSIDRLMNNGIDNLTGSLNTDLAMQFSVPKIEPLQDINSNLKLTMSSEPMELNFSFGGKSFRAIIDSITEAQGKQIALELAY